MKVLLAVALLFSVLSATSASAATHPLDSGAESRRMPRSFGASSPDSPMKLPFLVDFDELNALAATFDDYPSPEDILHASPQPNADQVEPVFRQLTATPSGYVYRIPDNPIRLPERDALNGRT